MIWSIVFPFVVLCGFAYGYSGKQDPLLRISIFPSQALGQPALSALKETPGIQLLTTDDEPRAKTALEHYESDLLIQAGDARHLVYSLNRDSDKGRLAERLLLDAASRQPEKPALEASAVTGHKIRYADWLLPGL